jgi:hypothetical protein
MTSYRFRIKQIDEKLFVVERDMSWDGYDPAPVWKKHDWTRSLTMAMECVATAKAEEEISKKYPIIHYEDEDELSN